MISPLLQQGTRPGQAELLDRQLQALAGLSRILAQPALAAESALSQALALLHDDLGLLHGLVTLADPGNGAQQIAALHSESDAVNRAAASVRYRLGEGLLGNVLKHGHSMALGRVSSDPRFLDRLALYDLEMPFIAVPIKIGQDRIIGVLAAQPEQSADPLMAERTRFLEIVANLLAPVMDAALNANNRAPTIQREPTSQRGAARAKYGFEHMVVGNTASMRRVFDQVRRVAKWDTTVLILGESGTGKELIASAIHYNSPRAHHALVRLNCAALPESLLESELFGHEKGAFTGAVKQRKGRFEQADGGTLFLDEVGEISPTFQAKLLRVLQEGEFERVGGDQTIKVNVRIVAATNRDLESEVEKGRFREDLYYRLNVMAIRIPPLRERATDIPLLAEFLLDKIAAQQGRPLTLTDTAARLLMGHSWPGNVRELENALERSAIMSEEGEINDQVVSLSGLDSESLAPLPAPDLSLGNENMDDRERVIAALEQAGWVQAKAARLLGMTPRQIAYRIQTLNIPLRKL